MSNTTKNNLDNHHIQHNDHKQSIQDNSIKTDISNQIYSILTSITKRTLNNSTINTSCENHSHLDR